MKPFRVRCKVTKFCYLTNHDSPKYGGIYTVINQHDLFSKIYGNIRTFVVLKEFSSFNNYSLDSFDILSDDDIGERAPTNLDMSNGMCILQGSVNIIPNHVF